MPDHLHHLEQQSIHLIRESFARLKPLAMLCPPVAATDPALPFKDRTAARWTPVSNQLIAERSFADILPGIHRDEQGAGPVRGQPQGTP